MRDFHLAFHGLPPRSSIFCFDYIPDYNWPNGQSPLSQGQIVNKPAPTGDRIHLHPDEDIILNSEPTIASQIFDDYISICRSIDKSDPSCLFACQ